ncbi:unnamed protein product [Toxocara canis]|uniref:RING-type E3 ubiquitin transferase (cysteine targeting) n=1 Tax=Toxocara canis TaxID=6265 RepID=A0A183UQH7_TOXCA|nr:unnamed protein product [Toxocara canis]
MSSEALRVVQLDSHILDSEVEVMVHSGLDSLVAQLPHRSAPYVQRFRMELQLVTDFLLWSHRISQGCSPGQKLLNIRYEGYSKCTVTAHFFVTVLIPYVRHRFSQMLSGSSPSKLVERIDAAYRLVRLIYHFMFLHFGGYGTLVERLLRLRTVYCSPPVLGTVNFDTMNRELIWHAFRDLFLFILPFRVAFKRLSFWYKMRQMAAFKNNENGASRSHDLKSPQVLSQQREGCYSGSQKLDSIQRELLSGNRNVLACVYCKQEAIIPVRSNACRHVYCYYCFWVQPWCTVCSAMLELRFL